MLLCQEAEFLGCFLPLGEGWEGNFLQEGGEFDAFGVSVHAGGSEGVVSGGKIYAVGFAPIGDHTTERVVWCEEAVEEHLLSLGAGSIAGVEPRLDERTIVRLQFAGNLNY